MDGAQFKFRTKALALAVIDLVEHIPRTRTSDVLSRQLIRSATSVGANYRASCRGRSVAEVIAKLSIVEEEADETMYWLELLQESAALPAAVVAPLLKETNELLAMTVASKKTLKARIGQGGGFPPSKIANRESEIPSRDF